MKASLLLVVDELYGILNIIFSPFILYKGIRSKFLIICTHCEIVFTVFRTEAFFLTRHDIF